MQTKILFISDHLSDFSEFLKQEPEFGQSLEMMSHPEANRRHVYQNYYDLFIVDLKEPWLAIPPWVHEQAHHHYFFQVIFISDHPISEELDQLLSVRIFKVVSRSAAREHLKEIIAEVSSFADQHRFTAVKHTSPVTQGMNALIGSHGSIKGINKFIDIVSRTRSAPCLIRGELGSGKHLCAELIHQKNGLTPDTLYTKSCENITTNEMLGDLFGVEGDNEIYGPRRKGLLEKYSNGTLILNDIEKLSLEVQNKLLLYLENHVFMVPGSKRIVESQTRIIGLTSHNLEWFVRHQNFNSGLFYRLNAFEIILPPLRERRDDIEQLANYYLQYYNNQLGKEIRSISPVTLQMMREYNWPGNITELKNIMERAVILSSSNQILPEDLPDNLQNDMSMRQSSEYIGNCTLKELERIHIHHVLLRTKGNKSKAAEVLDISRTTLREKMRIYSIEV